MHQTVVMYFVSCSVKVYALRFNMFTEMSFVRVVGFRWKDEIGQLKFRE